MVSEGTKLRANCKKIVENKFVRNKICINLYFFVRERRVSFFGDREY